MEQMCMLRVFGHCSAWARWESLLFEALSDALDRRCSSHETLGSIGELLL